jgi:hypothetical protein
MWTTQRGLTSFKQGVTTGRPGAQVVGIYKYSVQTVGRLDHGGGASLASPGGTHGQTDERAQQPQRFCCGYAWLSRLFIVRTITIAFGGAILNCKNSLCRSESTQFFNGVCV